MKPWDDRPGAHIACKQSRLVQTASSENCRCPGFCVRTPAALELEATGFDLELLDRTNQGHDKLMQVRTNCWHGAQGSATPTSTRHGLDDEPVQFDSTGKGSALGSQSPISITRCRGLGLAIRQQLHRPGRVKRVFIQAMSSRMLPQDLTDWYVRNSAGQMVPFSRLRYEVDQGSPSWSVITACPRSRSWCTGRRITTEPRSMPWQLCETVPPASTSNGPVYRTKNAYRVQRRRRCMPFP